MQTVTTTTTITITIRTDEKVVGETLGSQLDDLHFIRAHEILGFRTKAFLLGPAEGAHVPHGAGRWKRSVGRVARGGPRDEPVMYEGRATGTRGGGREG